MALRSFYSLPAYYVTLLFFGAGGLGLMSMEERVNVLRGTIDIDTQPGRGTEVRVEVPLEEASHEPDENHPGR